MSNDDHVNFVDTNTISYNLNCRNQRWTEVGELQTEIDPVSELVTSGIQALNNRNTKDVRIFASCRHAKILILLCSAVWNRVYVSA